MELGRGEADISLGSLSLSSAAVWVWWTSNLLRESPPSRAWSPCGADRPAKVRLDSLRSGYPNIQDKLKTIVRSRRISGTSISVQTTSDFVCAAKFADEEVAPATELTGTTRSFRDAEQLAGAGFMGRRCLRGHSGPRWTSCLTVSLTEEISRADAVKGALLAEFPAQACPS